jgi:4-diphosphocytidyl-2-C-methyl-D-erythritol kinase
MGVEVLCPAKLNLFLEVLRRRADGFHDIESLLATVSLWDTLTFEDAPRAGIVVECRWAGGVVAAGQESSAALPSGRDNLAHFAADLVRLRAAPERGARIRIVKRIPLGAGLGGASSNAAAVLIAANMVWGLDWPADRLAELAAEVGSDVPYFLVGGAAVCRGRGEQVEPLGPLATLHVVVVKPPVALSTADVYRRCRPGAYPMSVADAVDCWKRGDTSQLGRRIANRLTAAAQQLTPWMARLREELGRAGGIGFGMTGSGSAWFTLCRSARHARRVAATLHARNTGQVYPLATMN